MYIIFNLSSIIGITLIVIGVLQLKKQPLMIQGNTLLLFFLLYLMLFSIPIVTDQQLFSTNKYNIILFVGTCFIFILVFLLYRKKLFGDLNIMYYDINCLILSIKKTLENLKIKYKLNFSRIIIFDLNSEIKINGTNDFIKIYFPTKDILNNKDFIKLLKNNIQNLPVKHKKIRSAIFNILLGILAILFTFLIGIIIKIK